MTNYDFGGLVMHEDGDRLIVDRADQEVQIDADIVRRWMAGTPQPHFVVDLGELRPPRISCGTPGEGAGFVTYEVNLPAQGLATLRRR